MALVAPSPLPEQAEVVLGVDTHKEIHVAAVLTVLGVFLAGREFPATAAGYRGMVAWARPFGALRRAGEGTGSYGAALARTLRAEAVTVVEVNGPDRSARRRRGKEDAVDAEAAAHAVLSGEATATPKGRSRRYGSSRPQRTLRQGPCAGDQPARGGAGQRRPGALRGPDPAKHPSAHRPTCRPRLRPTPEGTPPRRPTQPRRPCTPCGTSPAASSTSMPGSTTCASASPPPSGPPFPACSRSTASAPTRPPPCSLPLATTPTGSPPRHPSPPSAGSARSRRQSGKTQRHRLNRGGHRHANTAFYRAVLTRLRWNPRTRDDLQRRTTEGLSKRGIIRCLKRYLAGTVYRITLLATQTAPPSAAQHP